MAEIEVYQKLAASVEGEKPEEILFAIDFLRQKTQSALYAAQQVNSGCANAIGSMQYAAESAQKAHAQGVEIVRAIVREEMAAAAER